MKTKLFFIAISLFCTIQFSHAYSHIQVNDPRNGGLWAQGNISHANVTITPQGNFFKYELELEFTVGKTTNTGSFDSLEISCNFSLPENSLITNASLLIGDEWINAILMPRKEAHAIYEGVVQRRQDPLIIYKNSDNNYLFKIFPISMTGSRKIKLTYIVDSKNISGNKSAGLPTELFQASETPVDIHVFIKKTDDFPNPEIIGGNATFTDSDDKPGYIEATIPADVTVPAIVSSAVYNSTQFNSSTKNNEITYKFNCNLANEFAIQESKKYLFIIDNDPTIVSDTIYYYNYYYNGSTSSYDKEVSSIRTIKPLSNEVIYSEVSHMLSTVTSSDKFMIVVKNNDIYKSSNEWLLATPENIQSSITAIKNNDNTYTSNISQLLNSCKDLINEDGVLPIVLSNSKENYKAEYSTIQKIVNDLYIALGLTNQVYLWDISSLYDNSDNSYYYFYNNFLSQLSYKLQNANYYNSTKIYYRTDFLNYFTSLKTQNLSKLLLLQVNVHSDNGMIYQRAITNPKDLLPTNDYTEFGKITDGTKFIAEISFMYKGTNYMKRLEFPIEPKTDTLLEDLWAANIVSDLNATYQTEAIKEAEKLSGEHGILTQNTAFLSLEPGVVVEPCYDCPDWNGIPTWQFIGMNDRIFMLDMAVPLADMSMYAGSEGSAPTNNTNTSYANSGIDYFDLGYELGKSESTTDCSLTMQDSYNQGYNIGYAAAQDVCAKSETLLQAFPTSITTELTITVESSTPEIVEIYTASGNFVESFTINKVAHLDASNSALFSLPNGTYILKSVIQGKTKYTTIIKQ